MGFHLSVRRRQAMIGNRRRKIVSSLHWFQEFRPIKAPTGMSTGKSLSYFIISNYIVTYVCPPDNKKRLEFPQKIMWKLKSRYSFQFFGVSLHKPSLFRKVKAAVLDCLGDMLYPDLL